MLTLQPALHLKTARVKQAGFTQYGGTDNGVCRDGYYNSSDS